ncbi:hypothetical protein HT574_14675 [Parageobacillus sp. VR-IP]|jgi:hypothetical protein|nr:hypothetical protein [Parageobacillus sp. VR-IP]NUK31292.1 hypothetical protein [Parageobacillus sp. VR-IP]
MMVKNVLLSQGRERRLFCSVDSSPLQKKEEGISGENENGLSENEKNE